MCARPVVVADMGGTTIKAARFEGRATRAVARLTVATPADDYAALCAALAETLETLAGDAATAGFAVATAGAIDPDTGVALSANVPCLTGRQPAIDLAARLGRSVGFLNDADAFALAEARAGVGRGRRVVLGIVLGTGVGGGLVVEGRLVRGAGGVVGEWGHGPIAVTRPEGCDVEVPRFACGCGQVGCADTFGGARGLERLHATLGAPPADSREIVAGWRAGAAAAVRTVEIWAEMLAEPLALAVNLVGASIVPASGGLGSDPALMARLDVAVRRRTLRHGDDPLVVPARFGAEAGLVGAAAFARAARGGR